MSRLEEISEYINQLSFDLKAEMLVAVLAEQKIDLKEILAAFDGQLKRAWSKDIDWATVDRLETGNKMISLHLNRDGIYDTLPEGMFHSNFEKENQSGKEMGRDSMKLRAEEKEARTFFQPFENEIFRQGVQLAMMENQLFKSVNTEYLMGIIPYIWRIDQDLPEDYVSRLKKLLPLVHQITGNINLTAQCLEFILKEKVKITTADDHGDDVSHKGFHNSGVLGKSSLGVNTICGNLANCSINSLLCSIGPITKPETAEIVKEGRMNRFLACFYSYLIPVEFDIDTKYIFETEQSVLVLNDNIEAEISYLGFNSVIE